MFRATKDETVKIMSEIRKLFSLEVNLSKTNKWQYNIYLSLISLDVIGKYCK